jgi:hypothetical protein
MDCCTLCTQHCRKWLPLLRPHLSQLNRKGGVGRQAGANDDPGGDSDVPF